MKEKEYYPELTPEENANLSPMMKHYRVLKRKNPDLIIFYRLGDFYEMFDNDAVVVSELLGLTLTGKECGKGERAPMCGIPYHAIDQYLPKLVKAGKKVAICEQAEINPDTKIMDREIVRIVTAGTLTEQNQIDETKNNFIACVFYDSSTSIGISWADITTGHFYTQSFNGRGALDSLCDSLVRISPSEIISNTQIIPIAKELPIVVQGVIPQFYACNDRTFNFLNAERVLKEHFNVITLKGLGIEDNALSICSCGALIEYLSETQKHALKNISSVSVYVNSDYLYLGSCALSDLEIVRNSVTRDKYGSLLWVMDKCATSMGSRKLRQWVTSPLTDVEKIKLRLNAVEELYNNNFARENVISLLKEIKDIERLAGKISNGNISPRDCVVLRQSLEVLPSLKMVLTTLGSPFICGMEHSIGDFSEITKLLKSALVDNDTPTTTKDGGFIRNGFDEKLDSLRNIKETAQKVIDKMTEEERTKTGIKNLKIGFNKVFGYYIEVTNSYKNNVPYYFIRKQTLVNAERYITEDLKKLEEEVLSSYDNAIKIEIDIFNKILSLLNDRLDDIIKTANAISALDVISDFAYIAKTNKYAKPEVMPFGERLSIVSSRHAVVEKISKEGFIGNDVLMDNDENRTLIITGPNMAGKSTYMRQIALTCVMAQAGSFVPCRSAQIPIVDKIYTRVGASDNLISNQSTFMVEMTEVAEILMNATKNSLLIFDEVGRGTSTYDGLSIAWSVVEFLNEKIRAKTLFSTHYHELGELENLYEGIVNYKITIKESEGKLVFLRKVARGSANKSFGIEVASLAGIPEQITKRAKQILKKLAQNDLASSQQPMEFEIEEENDYNNEIVNKLLSLDLNNVTPIQALKILSDLKEIANAKD